MGITYSVSNNKTTVTGYSAVTPCNFTDLHTADKAGTLDLWSGTPTTNITLSTQIQPSDELSLKIDFILASSGAGVGDTIDVTGTDKDGGALSETLTTEADGTFTTTKWFKTITDVDCNGFSSGTLTIRQNQWGVFWNRGNFFQINCLIAIGDGVTATYFKDTNKQIEFPDIFTGTTYLITVALDAVVDLGTLVSWDSKITKEGCVINDLCSINFHRVFSATSGTVNLYASSILSTATRSTSQIKYGKVVSCYFLHTFFLYSNLDYYNIDFFMNSSGSKPYAFLGCTPISADKINVWGTTQIFGVGGTGDIIVKNVVARGITSTVLFNTSCTWSNSGANIYIIDADIEATTPDWGEMRYCDPQTAKLYRQYTFNLKVTDKEGNSISGVSVIVKDKEGNITEQKGFETTTNIDGEIAEQTVSYGHYDKDNGDTLQSYSPHALTITKAGYQTYNKKFTLSQKITWVIKLKRISINVDSEVIL